MTKPEVDWDWKEMSVAIKCYKLSNEAKVINRKQWIDMLDGGMRASRLHRDDIYGR